MLIAGRYAVGFFADRGENDKSLTLRFVPHHCDQRAVNGMFEGVDRELRGDFRFEFRFELFAQFIEVGQLRRAAFFGVQSLSQKFD